MAVSTLPDRRKNNPDNYTSDENIDTTPTNFNPKKVITKPISSDRVDRSSFSSVKESHGGTAQSFTDSKTSSYLRNEFDIDENEDVILDDGSSGATTPETEKRDFALGMLTQPHSNLFAFTPCDGFRGWKDIPLMAQTIKNIKSKSYSDLARLNRGFQWEVQQGDRMDLDVVLEEKKDISLPPGKSKFESLPVELLGKSERCFPFSPFRTQL